MSQLDDLLGGLLGGKDGGTGLDDILGQLTGGGDQGGAKVSAGDGMLAMLLPLVASFLQHGGLYKVLSGLPQQGLSSQAASWVGTGENEAVSGAEIGNVLGSDEIDAIAQQLGISSEQAADAVAQVLPRLVDQVSPQGELPSEPDLDELFAHITAAGR